MTEALALLLVGLLFVAVGLLAWGIRRWPRDETDGDFLP